jgi:L-phenylalanine/L-methionine N-acetyltransferase
MFSHRLAKISDIPYLYSLYFHEAVNPWLLYDPMSKAAFTPIITELLDQKIKYVFEHDGVPVGMFKLIPSRFRSAHVGYLGGLAIDPNFAGMGLGKMIFKAILEEAKLKNLSRIELSVGVSNDKAISLYTKVGFEKEGRLRNYAKFADGSMMDEDLYSILI